MNDPVLTTLNNRFGRLSYHNRWRSPLHAEVVYQDDKKSFTDAKLDHYLSDDEIRIIATTHDHNTSIEEEIFETVPTNLSNESFESVESETDSQKFEISKNSSGFLSIYNTGTVPNFDTSAYEEYLTKVDIYEQKWNNLLQDRVRQCINKFTKQYKSHWNNFRGKKAGQENNEQPIDIQCIQTEIINKPVFDERNVKLENLSPETTVYNKPENQISQEDDEIKRAEIQCHIDSMKLAQHERQKEFDRLDSQIETELENLEKIFKKMSTELNKSNLGAKALDLSQMVQKKRLALRMASKRDCKVELVDKMKELLQTIKLVLKTIDNSLLAVLKTEPEKKEILRPQPLIISPNSTFVRRTSTPVLSELPKFTTLQQPDLKQAKQVSKVEKTTVPEKFSASIVQEVYNDFCILMSKFEQLKQSISDFSSSDNMNVKKLRLQIKAGIKASVNKMSGATLRDSVNNITLLLKGATLDMAPNNRLTLNHPVAKTFFVVQLCEELLNSVEKQISHSPLTVYYVAAATVAICTEFPYIIDILLATLYLRCPYLVPFYVKPIDNQHWSEFTSVEKVELDSQGRASQLDQELKRVTACARFYAALHVTVAPKRPGAKANENHNNAPFGLSNIWTLLAGLLQLKPHYQLTACVLKEVLQLTGQKMQTTYRRQFTNLMNMIQSEFLKKIQTETEGLPMGVFGELEVLLEKRIYLETPPNFPGANIWQLGYSRGDYL